MSDLTDDQLAGMLTFWGMETPEGKMIAELQKRRSADRWLPISEAPRDGTHILACRGPYDQNWTFQQGPPDVVHYWSNPGEEGFYPSYGPDEPSDVKWFRPLPEPPVAP